MAANEESDPSAILNGFWVTLFYYYIETSYTLTLGLQSTTERNKKVYILFSLVNALQHSLPNYICLIGIQTKGKRGNHFKIVECRSTFRSNGTVSLGACRAKSAVFVYGFYGSTECRDYYPEQLHQFHF